METVVIKNVVINGVEYQPVSAGGEEKMIVICDNRGLTFVGDVDLSGDSDMITIRNAQCIIRWGTTEHLAELVHGPKDETSLGTKEDVIVFRRNLVAAYRCGSGWK